MKYSYQGTYSVSTTAMSNFLQSFLRMEGTQGENQPGSTAPQPTPGGSLGQNPLFKQVSFWGAILVFIGFFMPWIDLFIASASGFKIATAGMIGELGINATRFLLLLLPVAAGLYAYQGYSKKIIVNTPYLRYVPAAALLIFILANMGGGGSTEPKSLEEAMNMSRASAFEGIFKVAAVGFYFSLVGTILMCLNYKLGDGK
jgi:hypothetical protein